MNSRSGTYESAIGTTRTSRDVCYLAVFGGKADIVKATHTQQRPRLDLHVDGRRCERYFLAWYLVAADLSVGAG
jgi:hypothetical protein